MVTESAAILNTLRASANIPLSPLRSEVLDLATPLNPCSRRALPLVPVKFQKHLAIKDISDAQPRYGLQN